MSDIRVCKCCINALTSDLSPSTAIPNGKCKTETEETPDIDEEEDCQCDCGFTGHIV